MPTDPLTDVWDRHGAVLFAMSCALLGDELAAVRATRYGMLDLVTGDDHPSGAVAERATLVRLVLTRCQELQESPLTVRAATSPLQASLGAMPLLQRAALALCVYAGQTYREAAALLDVPPGTLVDQLSCALHEVARRTAGGAEALPV